MNNSVNYPYPRPSLTVDCVVLRGFHVLLIRRGGEPFKGELALPGGYVNEGESAEQAVARELLEETGVTCDVLHQVGTFSAPSRDPRGWSVTVAFMAVVAEHCEAVASDDAAAVEWVHIDEARGLAFDHDEILRVALGRQKGDE